MAAPPEYRIRAVARRITRIQDAATLAQLRILRAARRDILARLVDAGAFERWRLTQLLQVIDREILVGSRLSQDAVERAMRGAWGEGVGFARIVVPEPRLMIGVSSELLQSILRVTTDQARDVWGELGSKLKTLIRRAALGVQDPFGAMKALAKLIRDPKTFGRAFWRAETIVRTEVSRTFSLAGQAELERAAGAGVTIRKYWLTAKDERVRDAHRKAGQDYGPAGAIPWDGLFVVGGERLVQPLDPNGSAGQTINCRCVSVPVVIEE